MSASRLSIEPLNLRWLVDDDPRSDLCAHGSVRVTYGDETLLDTGADDYAVSTGALYLLRTLELDHLSTEEDYLFPHCGHDMVLDEATNTLMNFASCGYGVDWRVRHIRDESPQLVQLEFYDGPIIQIESADWRSAVSDFSQKIRTFYFSGGQKTPSDDWSKKWHDAFLLEWEQRHHAAARQ